MKFETQHNGEVISLEYHAEDCEDGQVYQCDVTYKGVDVTELLINEYGNFLEECKQHLQSELLKILQADELDRGLEMYEAKQETLRHYTAQLDQIGGA